MTPASTPLEAFLIHVGALTWDDIVTGYDFGFLAASEIQAEVSGLGPHVRRLRALSGFDLYDFETHLWAACSEAAGKTPRPGSSRWAQAQDRWRAALLSEVLATDMTTEQLACAVEHIYDRVGCPEDMLAMLRPSQPWSGQPARVDLAAVKQFMNHCCPGHPQYFGAASRSSEFQWPHLSLLAGDSQNQQPTALPMVHGGESRCYP